ncbi:hypothetical protein RRG08_038623 [Elysia crispata]|uniref:Uncharacterized protein n=1 Tax=Elysia crispata TaxID=231223 RepID=A0AAE0YL56_9GAST|nr:hypothetical protein RRG08_038623 [Elysia crispata]
MFGGKRRRAAGEKLGAWLSYNRDMALGIGDAWERRQRGILEVSGREKGEGVRRNRRIGRRRRRRRRRSSPLENKEKITVFDFMAFGNIVFSGDEAQSRCMGAFNIKRLGWSGFIATSRYITS